MSYVGEAQKATNKLGSAALIEMPGTPLTLGNRWNPPQKAKQFVTEFKEVLGADTLLLGLGLPDDNAHSPNEKMSLTAFTKGMHMSAELWQNLAAHS